jgi:hypothetical protein
VSQSALISIFLYYHIPILPLNDFLPFVFCFVLSTVDGIHAHDRESQSPTEPISAGIPEEMSFFRGPSATGADGAVDRP